MSTLFPVPTLPDTRPLFQALICILGVFLATPPVMATERLLEQISSLEEDFKAISRDYFTAATQQQTQPEITDIEQLQSTVKQHSEQNRPIQAIELLYANKETLNSHIDHRSIFYFIELLLSQNEWHLAKQLYEDIQYEGDRSLTATVQFLFAKYHAQRHEWVQVHDLLDGQFSELSADNAAYAYLLHGSALQHLKKHREAASSYSRIPPSSRFYYHGQLNTAIANIRQGWWTDAQTKINQLINSTTRNNSDELVNRLNLVLGYSLLQREYYRDARDAFRRIGLNSRYTNRALLGIGLTATSQGDFVGGLNALSILKEKKTSDLSVDESYLLIPYVYEKLQQELTVTASYSEAMNYYQDRIQHLSSIGQRRISLDNTEYDEATSSLIINNNSLNYTRYYPQSFIKNYLRLGEFNAQAPQKRLRNKIQVLLKKHEQVFNGIVTNLLDIRIKYLKSYLNQSRYGLARLYDGSQEARN